jgi:hypothetical protein
MLTFKDIKVGDKFKFGPNSPTCIKVEGACDHPEAGLAVYDINYATKPWPVWHKEEIILVNPKKEV